MTPSLAPVPLDKAYRLINHGPTVLISASAGGRTGVMAASWACGLDFSPAKVTVVLDKIAFTRRLVEETGAFVMQVPTVAQAKLVHVLGTTTQHDDPEKLSHSGVAFFDIDGREGPYVAGCSAWLSCKVLPIQSNEQDHDLFIAEVIGAWADTRVFRDGHWEFDSADPSLRGLHYIAGGQFYATGASVVVSED